VFFKSQNPYTYTEAKNYCNRQNLSDPNSTGVGIHSSQLWTLANNGKHNTLKNKLNIWKSETNVTWELEYKERHDPKACPGFPKPALPGVDCVSVSGRLVSGEKNPEKKDTNGDNKNTKNKEKGVLEKAKDFWSHWVDRAKKFWLRLGDSDGDTKIAIPGKKEQVWKKTDLRDYPSYFTLENMDSDKVLTDVNGILQLKGMF
jgi:hypothetical protein